MSDLMSATEAAEFLGISPTTLTRWEADGILPEAQRVGRFRVYEREVLEAWKQEQRPQWLALRAVRAEGGIRAKHGTYRRYQHHGCRCDACVAAKRAKNHRYLANKKRRSEG